MSTQTLTEIDSEEVFNSTVSSLPPSTLIILYFHTPWAAPCAQMNTILTTLASTYSSSAALRFLSINAEDLPDVSETYDVTAVPFLVLVRDGKTLETVSGSDAVKVRTAVEKWAGKPEGEGVQGKQVNGIPPALEVTPQPQTYTQSTQDGVNGDTPTATKDLSSYAPDGAAKEPQVSPQESQEQLNERLAKLVKAAPVMLFMKGTPSAPQCGFSRQLVGILRENQVKYGFFNILADNDVREGLKVFSDWPTFPQLYTNGDLIGGLDIVREELAADPDFFKPFTATAA